MSLRKHISRSGNLFFFDKPRSIELAQQTFCSRNVLELRLDRHVKGYNV